MTIVEWRPYPTLMLLIRDPVGQKPVANWHGPIEVPRLDDFYSYYSYYYSYWYGSGSGGRMDYIENDIEFGSTLFLQVEAFDPPHIDETGKSIPGGIEKVTFLGEKY